MNVSNCFVTISSLISQETTNTICVSLTLNYENTLGSFLVLGATLKSSWKRSRDSLNKQKMLTALATLMGSTMQERVFLMTATLELEYVFLILGPWQNNWSLRNINLAGWWHSHPHAYCKPGGPSSSNVCHYLGGGGDAGHTCGTPAAQVLHGNKSLLFGNEVGVLFICLFWRATYWWRKGSLLRDKARGFNLEVGTSSWSLYTYSPLPSEIEHQPTTFYLLLNTPSARPWLHFFEKWLQINAVCLHH